MQSDMLLEEVICIFTDKLMKPHIILQKITIIYQQKH